MKLIEIFDKNKNLDISLYRRELIEREIELCFDILYVDRKNQIAAINLIKSSLILHSLIFGKNNSIDFLESRKHWFEFGISEIGYSSSSLIYDFNIEYLKYKSKKHKGFSIKKLIFLYESIMNY